MTKPNSNHLISKETIMKKYLVEIKTKTWVKKPMTISYKEVEAEDEYFARHKAFDLFEQDLKYKASVRRLLTDNVLTVKDVAASDAVEL